MENKKLLKSIYSKEYEYLGKKYCVDFMQNASEYKDTQNISVQKFIGHTIKARFEGTLVYEKTGIKSTDIESELQKATQAAESYIDEINNQENINIDSKMEELGYTKEYSEIFIYTSNTESTPQS